MIQLPNLDLARVQHLLADRFEIGAVLGAGASGAVLRARSLGPSRAPDGRLDRGPEVALKVLRPERAADPIARETLLREAELGKRVRDPHVVAILGVGEVADGDGTLLYLVTELVRGRSLRERIESAGAVVGDLARRIAEQAALGLAALHEAGIVHRDVKPENLLIADGDSEVRLTDLGLARTEDGPSPVGSSSGFHGSLAYAAPELLRGGIATPASDLYALGIVLFEILTLEHPFAAARNADELMRAQLHDAPPRASHKEPRVSAFLETIVAELLSKNPSDRPPSARALAKIFADGEASAHWRAREHIAPALASRRRLLGLQRTRHTDLIDREAERRVLDSQVREVAGGAGRSVVVHGHAGSGRRRLLDECIERWLERRELVFLGGVAANEPTSRLGSPFGQIICDVLLEGEREDAPRARDRLAQRAQEQLGFESNDAKALAELCVGEPTAAAPDRGARADLLARAIARIVGRSGATVLRIDRADDLNSTALAVVELLIERALAMPLLLILVTTSPWEGEPSPDLQLEIGPLDVDAFVELGRRLFRGGQAPLDLVRAAHASLSGQPRALIESLEECVSLGTLTGRPGSFRDLARSVAELLPPRTAVQRLRDRVAALDPVVRHVLQAAAVLGDHFALADLARLTGRPELDVLDHLGTFDNRFTGIEGGEGRFRHRAYRTATLAATPPGVLRALYRDAAWVREDRGASRLEVGMHLSRAMEEEACLDPLIDGLHDLVHAHVRRTTGRVVERIRFHLNRLPRTARNLDRRLRWLLLSGRAWLQLDDEEHGSRAFRKAILLARHLGRVAQHAEALVGLAEFGQLHSRYLGAIQLLASAEQMLRDQDDDVARVVRTRTLMIHARVLAYLGDALAALRLAGQALRILPPGNDELETHLRIDYARWLALRLHFVRALSEIERAGRLAEECGDAYGTLRADLHRGRVLGTLGEIKSARAAFERAYAAALRLGDIRMRARARLFAAELDVLVGRAPRARALLLEAEADAAGAGDTVMAEHATACLLLADPTRVTPAEPHAIGAPLSDLSWLCMLALRRRTEGDEAGATKLLREACHLERRARVPLLLRLFLLRAAGRDQGAGRLVATAVERMPVEYRRRFLTFVERVRP